MFKFKCIFMITSLFQVMIVTLIRDVYEPASPKSELARIIRSRLRLRHILFDP